ncbi:MAG: hypothetical protein OEL76_01780 [Siculibacillus sp.]|nr:hypothetical protein [Siculibacillus sp.]
MSGGGLRFAATVLLTATAVVYAQMLLVTLPHLAAIAAAAGSADPRMFDLRPAGYDLAAARDLLAALGPAGRAEYLEVQHRLDAVFPALNGLTLALGLAFVGVRLGLTRPIAIGLATVIAAPTALLDWAENASVAVLLALGPAGIGAETVAAASRYTVAKSIAVTIVMSLLLVGLAMVAWRQWRKTRS